MSTFRIQIPVPEVRVQRLCPEATLPVYASQGANGMDLYTIEEVLVPAHGQVLARTGLAMAIPKNWTGMIKTRSSLAARGLGTEAGVIDSDYRGEIRILLLNRTPNDVVIGPQVRVAQMLILFCPKANLVEGPLDQTERGSGGFGSTGTQQVETPETKEPEEPEAKEPEV